MKILKLSPYYYPEKISSSHLDDDLEKAIIDSGFDIEVFAPTPTRGVSREVSKLFKSRTYEELYNGHLVIHRFRMFKEGKNPIIRALRYILVNCIQFFKALNLTDVDLIYAASTPPTQGLLCGLVRKALSKKLKKNIPFIYNLQDIFPDSLVNAGLAKKGSIVWKLGRIIEDYTYNCADSIIVISDGFKNNIVSKGVNEKKINVISNWIDLNDVHPVSRVNNRLIEQIGLNKKDFIVVYAGNFGAVQGADILLKVAKKLNAYSSIKFVIFGGGPFFNDARLIAKDLDNVYISELLPMDRVSEVYSLGDVALITCKKGTGSAGMPSKVWSIMACNTPVIASFDLNSDLDIVLRKSGAGICVKPEDVDALAEAILENYNKRNRCVNSRNFVKDNASKEFCISKYVSIIKKECNCE